jgi:hypothetical protein
MARWWSAGMAFNVKPPLVRLLLAPRALRADLVYTYFTYIRLMRSPTSILSTTSMPDVT